MPQTETEYCKCRSEDPTCTECWKPIALVANHGWSADFVRCSAWVADRREMKKLHKSLEALVSACEQSISALDKEMRAPSTVERGKRIAKISNFLDFEKDRSKHFGLGKPLRREKPR